MERGLVVLYLFALCAAAQSGISGLLTTEDGKAVGAVIRALTFNFSDPNGTANIVAAEGGTSHCMPSYQYGAFWRVNNAGNGLLGPVKAAHVGR